VKGKCHPSEKPGVLNNDLFLSPRFFSVWWQAPEKCPNSLGRYLLKELFGDGPAGSELP